MDVRIFDRSDSRLGRHQVHDPRSRRYGVPATALKPKFVLHQRHAPIWDQGDLGSCTANAALGCLVTGPLYKPGRHFNEDDATLLYERETRLDDSEIPGHYPPDDTGSAGIYSAKALVARGWITGYQHAFSLATMLAILSAKPVTVGVPWYDSMMEPGADGRVRIEPGAKVVGGHQVCFDGQNPAKQLTRFANSWSASWGARGWGWIDYDDLGRLLSEGGDVTSFIA